MIIFYTYLGFQIPATTVMEAIVDMHNYIFFYLILVFIFVMWMYFYIFMSFYILPSYFYDFLFIQDFDKNNSLFSVILKIIFLFYYFFFIKKLNIFKLSKHLERAFNNKLFKFFKILVFVEDEMKVDIEVFYYVYFTGYFYSIFEYIALIQQEYILKTRLITHHTNLEIIWTLIPSFFLFFIAFPSFLLLYEFDEIIKANFTFKVIGYQWFWTYEINNFLKKSKLVISRACMFYFRYFFFENFKNYKKRNIDTPYKFYKHYLHVIDIDKLHYNFMTYFYDFHKSYMNIVRKQNKIEKKFVNGKNINKNHYENSNKNNQIIMEITDKIIRSVKIYISDFSFEISNIYYFKGYV